MEALYIGLVSACASIFLQYCYSAGNIFYPIYKLLLIRLYYCYNVKRSVGGGFIIKKQRVTRLKHALYKILGGCIYCNNPYLTALLYTLYSVDNFSLITLIFSIFIAHICIRILLSLENYLNKP